MTSDQTSYEEGRRVGRVVKSEETGGRQKNENLRTFW